LGNTVTVIQNSFRKRKNLLEKDQFLDKNFFLTQGWSDNSSMLKKITGLTARNNLLRRLEKSFKNYNKKLMDTE